MAARLFFTMNNDVEAAVEVEDAGRLQPQAKDNVRILMRRAEEKTHVNVVE